MTKPSSVAPIPKIEVIKKGVLWEVHWDYQEGPASLILFNRADYLRGYIDGALDILGIDPACVCCASGVTGTVNSTTSTASTNCGQPMRANATSKSPIISRPSMVVVATKSTGTSISGPET